ncbi:SymE family type I addiction module toxin [Niabella aquatica]
MRNDKRKTIRRPDVRSLKIQPDIKINRWSQTTVPVIKLSGLWLDRLGFAPEQRVTVTTMDKLLIMRLDEQH